MPKTFLDGEAANGGDDGVAEGFEFFDVGVVFGIEAIRIFQKIFVERVVDDVDFFERDVVFFVDEAFGGFRDGKNAIGKKKTFALDFVDERVATVHTGTVEFSRVDVGD